MAFTSQVGSLDDTVDYDVHNHVGFISGTFTPRDTLKFDFGVSYTHSKAKADDPSFGQVWFEPSTAEGLPFQDPTYNTDFSEANEFSDLKVGILDFSAGCEVMLRKDVHLKVRGVVRNVEDEDPYLEEHDGTVYGVSVGLIYEF